MASIRKLKNEINQKSFELINQCFAFKHINPDNAGQVDKVIMDLIRMRNELIRRSNNPEDKADAKKLGDHYRKIRADLGKLSELAHSEHVAGSAPPDGLKMPGGTAGHR